MRVIQTADKSKQTEALPNNISVIVMLPLDKTYYIHPHFSIWLHSPSDIQVDVLFYGKSEVQDLNLL